MDNLPFNLHERYGRLEAYEIFGIEYNQQQQHLNLGMSPRLPDGGYFIFITLDKGSYDESYDYDDQIFKGELFTTTRRGRSEDHPDYANLRQPEIRKSLFLRNNKSEVSFIYAGELSYKSHTQFIDKTTGKPQQTYVFNLDNQLTDDLLQELTFGMVREGVRQRRAIIEEARTRKPSNFDEFKKAFSYVLGEASARTVIPAHHNYQVELKNYLGNKNIVARFEENFIDVQFENEGDSYIGEIKVTTNISTSQAFRAALGQVLEYAHLKFDEKPKMIMFLDSQLDEQRLNLASSLSIAVVIKQDQNFRILNPETFENLSLIFET